MNARQRALITANVHLVRITAKQLAARLPAWTEVADLVSIGNMALVSAAERFDPKQGVQFATYARYRVRGAMLDALRGSRSQLGWMFCSEVRFAAHDQLHEDYSEEHGQADEDKPSVVAIDGRRSPEELADASLLAGHLTRALDCLDQAERTALLAHADGEPLREIGARFGHGTSWAHALVGRARSKMQRELAMHRLDAA